MSRRSVLRGQVWEMCGGQCEWPACDQPAAELAHIRPRGMGHTGYRDTLSNVMAACPAHARISDHEHPGGDIMTCQSEWEKVAATASEFEPLRDVLARHVRNQRVAAGFDPDGMEADDA